MDSKFWWWFIIYYLINIFINSIETFYLSNPIESGNESTNKNQMSTKSINSLLQYQSTFSTSLAENTTKTQSNDLNQSFITKPNSYFYDIEKDEEMLLDRVKRDTPPFVCKSNIQHY